MDIRKYEVFLKAAECGNFTKTGETMGYTQSGVSHMMKDLETEMGFPLFIRKRTGVTLTAEGERIIRIVREMVKWDEQLRQTVSSIRGLETGEISIGTFFSVSVNWLPRIIKRFQEEHPGIHVHLMEGGMHEIEEWLSEGRVDLGFFSYQTHHDFDWIPLKRDRLLAVLPAETSASEPLPLGYFEGQPFIMSAAGFDYDIHRILEENGVTPRTEFSSMDDYAIVAMVENELGVSILPELVLAGHSDRVTTRELSPAAYRTLGIALPSIKELSPAAGKFIDCTKRVLEENKL